MAQAAIVSIEEAKARAKEKEAVIPDFIKVKRKGRGEASKWYEGLKTGMVFKTGEHGIGYYKDEPSKTIELTKEVLPMFGCTPLKIMISEILEATPKEAKEAPPRTTPSAVKERFRLSRDPKP